MLSFSILLALGGFQVDRLSLSAPGGGWMVMDTVNEHGGLSGAAAFTLDYANQPLRHQVTDEFVADIGFAADYRRFRLYVNFSAPLLISGPATNVTLATDPDTLSDPRIGLDARIFGEPGSAFRLGAGAQLYVPSGKRADEDSDETYRGMLRLLIAGDVGNFTYAAHAGIHLRPLQTSFGPYGSEFLFGAAAGGKVALTKTWALILGPEVFGATAFTNAATALEGLLSLRAEGAVDRARLLRVKLSAGGGNENFGAPAYRVVLGIELATLQ